MRAGIINERECKNDPSQMISTHCDQCWKLFLLKVSDAAASASWPISWWIHYWKLAVKKWWFFFSASYTKRILFLWSYKGIFQTPVKVSYFFWKILYTKNSFWNYLTFSWVTLLLVLEESHVTQPHLTDIWLQDFKDLYLILLS